MSAVEETQSKRAKVESSSPDECVALKLHLTSVPSFRLGEKHVDNKVYVCKQSDLIVNVAKFMLDQHISSVPVLTEKHNRYYGWIDWVPILEYVITHFNKERENGAEGAADETKTTIELMQSSEHFKKLTVHDVMKYPRTNQNPFHPVRSVFSAFTAVEALARDHNLQRMCIISDTRTVVNIVTQSDVLRYIMSRSELITEGKKNKALGDCNNLLKPVVTVNENDTVFEAFSKVSRAQVHGAAIVKTTEEGVDRITGNLSLRDMKNLGFGIEKYWRLHRMNIHNYMLHLRQETEKGSRPRSWVTVKASESLFGAMQKLNDNNLHHIYILDDHSKVPIGVVSIQDILLELISN